MKRNSALGKNDWFRITRVLFLLWGSLLWWMADLQAAGVVGTGTPGSCTQAALINALTGGGTVTFNCGGPVTIPVISRMDITADTFIDGGGVITIDGGLATGLFYVIIPASLSLNNITLASAFATDGNGSAVRATGLLFLDNATIRDSQTLNAYCGGAIWSNGTVDIRNSTFTRNSGGFGGGAVCTGSLNPTNLQITRSTFNSNKTTDPANGFGGAILVNNNAQAIIVDSGFLNNSANAGGALAVKPGGTATLRTQDPANKLFFLGNNVTDSGGAVFNEGTLSIYGAELNGNTAPQNTALKGYGGAIVNVGTLAISDCLLSVNKGRFGGGLYSGGTNSITNIQRTVFSLNDSGSTGGGLYTSFGNKVTVDNSVFSKNTALVSGGGISRFNTLLEISNSSITENRATDPLGAGGGLFTGAGPGTDPTQVKATSVTIGGNAAGSGQGGGIYSNGGYSVLKNLTIHFNTNGIFQAGTGVTTHLANSVLSNPTFPNCAGTGTPVTDGNNLSSDNTCAVERNNTDAYLGPLVVNTNGINRTSYYPPLPVSPLINGAANCPTMDQRGAVRPGTCDIGAVEFGGLAWFNYLPLIKR